MEFSRRDKALFFVRRYLEDAHGRALDNSADILTPRLTQYGTMDKDYLSGGTPFEHEVAHWGIVGCGNRTVPIYVFPRSGTGGYEWAKNEDSPRLEDFSILLGHLYEFSSDNMEGDIDFYEGFSKVIVPELYHAPTGIKHGSYEELSQHIQTVLTLNKALCDTFDQARDALEEKDVTSPFTSLRIHPVFRACAIILVLKNSEDQPGMDVGEMDRHAFGNMNACLVHTGDFSGQKEVNEPFKQHFGSSGNTVYAPLQVLLNGIRDQQTQLRSDTMTAPDAPLYIANGIPRAQRYYSLLNSIPAYLTRNIPFGSGEVVGPSSSWIKQLSPYAIEKIEDEYKRIRQARTRAQVMIDQRLEITREMRRKTLEDHWFSWYRNLSPRDREWTNGA